MCAFYCVTENGWAGKFAFFCLKYAFHTIRIHQGPLISKFYHGLFTHLTAGTLHLFCSFGFLRIVYLPSYFMALQERDLFPPSGIMILGRPSPAPHILSTISNFTLQTVLSIMLCPLFYVIHRRQSNEMRVFFFREQERGTPTENFIINGKLQFRAYS
jgi:hypothetical protein